MKNNKAFFGDKIFSVICFVLVVLVLSNSSMILTNLNKKAEKKQTEKTVILSVWDIESFDSGAYSKTQFLEQVAIKFHNKKQNVCFVVKKMTLEGVKQAFLEGEFPDLISYSYSAMPLIKEYVKLLSCDIQKNFVCNTKNIAFPWCASAYFVFSFESELEKQNIASDCVLNKIFDLGYSVKTKKKQIQIESVVWGDNLNLNCLVKSGVESVKIFKKMTAYDAYLNFVNKKSVCLVGTNRDLFRLENKTEISSDLVVKLLSGYTDLVQYISVASVDEYKKTVCVEFLNYLFGDGVQKNMQNLGLFSCCGFDLFEDEMFASLQKQFNEIDCFEEVCL